MKGVLMFNQLNDLVFVSLDNELTLFINKLAHKSKLISEEQICQNVDTNVIIQLFSPLVASQRFMSGEVVNPYNTIRCQDGLTYVFRQFSELMAMAIGTETESEMFLHRKLLVLHRLLMFLYGPVPEKIHAQVLHEREKQWKFLSDLLDKWSELYQKEQCFLVEALERLVVNQGLNDKCISLLSTTLNMLRSAGGEKGVSHALLFVECKLLTLFSNRSAYDLDSADILLMMLFSSTVFPHTQSKLDDLSPLNSPFSGSSKSRPSLSSMNITDSLKRKGIFSKTQSSSSGSGSGSEKKMDSASLFTNTLRKSSSEEQMKTETKDLNFDEGKYHEWTFLDDRSGAYWDTPGSPLHGNSLSYYDNHSSFHSNSFSFPSRSNKGRLATDVRGDGFYGNSDSYKTLTVFLRTKICDFTPGVLHLLHVLPGVVLIFVNEIPKPTHATLITEALSLVISLLAVSSSSRSSGINTLVSSMETTLKKFTDIQKKYKGVSLVERILKDIHMKWDSFKRSGVTSLTQGTRQEHDRKMVRFENILSGLGERLKDLFSALFLLPRKMTPQAQQKLSTAVRNIHKRAYEQLVDYKDYLSIKSVRNIAITSYLEEFPGLVHFIYIDRKSNYMTAPSIHFFRASEKGSKDITEVIKEKVWHIVANQQDKLASGYTAVTSRDNAFYVSYFLWFEDAMGNPLVTQQAFRGDPHNTLPGVLAGDFYRKLMKDCFPSVTGQRSVCCYELLCIHIGLVPTQYVLSHCRKMAAMLWESTDAPFI